MTKEQQILAFETAYNKYNEKIQLLKTELESFKAMQSNYQLLHQYYSSEEWIKDYEASNNGEIDPNIPQGILSEDTLFDLIGDQYELALELIELGHSMLKNR